MMMMMMMISSSSSSRINKGSVPIKNAVQPLQHKKNRGWGTAFSKSPPPVLGSAAHTTLAQIMKVHIQKRGGKKNLFS